MERGGKLLHYHHLTPPVTDEQIDADPVIVAALVARDGPRVYANTKEARQLDRDSMLKATRQAHQRFLDQKTGVTATPRASSVEFDYNAPDSRQSVTVYCWHVSLQNLADSTVNSPTLFRILAFLRFSNFFCIPAKECVWTTLKNN